MKKLLMVMTVVFSLIGTSAYGAVFKGQEGEALFKKLIAKGKILSKGIQQDNSSFPHTFVISHQSQIYVCYVWVKTPKTNFNCYDSK